MRKALHKLRQNFLPKEAFLIGILGFMLMGIAECTHTPIKSLCKLDFNAKVCWLNKSKNQGFTFAAMASQQAQCKDQGSNVPCWTAIDTADIQRIATKLNQCENPSPQSVNYETESDPEVIDMKIQSDQVTGQAL